MEKNKSALDIRVFCKLYELYILSIRKDTADLTDERSLRRVTYRRWEDTFISDYTADSLKKSDYHAQCKCVMSANFMKENSQ